MLFLAAGLIGLEALGAIVFGIAEITQTRASRLVVGSGVALLMLSLGAFLVAVARGVARGRRWSRGPAVAIQLLQVLLAYSFAGGDTWWVTLALAPLAVLVLVCLLVPAATAVFVGPRPGP